MFVSNKMQFDIALQGGKPQPLCNREPLSGESIHHQEEELDAGLHSRHPVLGDGAADVAMCGYVAMYHVPLTHTHRAK